MELKKKIAAAIAGGALLLNIASPIAAASYTISGNNSGSDNYIDVKTDRDTTVTQNNDAHVDNSVTIKATTGGNTAKNVAGGDVTIDTGGSNVGVKVDNALNTNVADVNLCNGCATGGEFKISGNNSYTDNDIKYRNDSDVKLTQDNDAKVNNDVNITAGSGYNRVSDVVGGHVEVDTGMVTVNPVIIKNTLNSNWASLTSGGSDDESTLSAWIVDNNTDSDSYIDLRSDSDLKVRQNNDADIANDVAVAGDSGHNRVRDVAGAGVLIDTGDVEVGVAIDNMANFNWASVEDCCLLGLDLKIAGNNSHSDNDIAVKLDSDTYLNQDNDFDCSGGRNNYGDFLSRFFKGGDYGKGGKCSDVNVTAGSGGNSVKDSSTANGDPEIYTGGSAVGVDVSNEANINTIGGGEAESGDGGTSVHVNVDFGELTQLLHQLLDLLS